MRKNYHNYDRYIEALEKQEERFGFVSLELCISQDDYGNELSYRDVQGELLRPGAIIYSREKDSYLRVKDWADKEIARMMDLGWKDTRIQTYFRKNHNRKWSRERIRRIMKEIEQAKREQLDECSN